MTTATVPPGAEPGKEFWTALLAARARFGAVHKDGRNPHLKNAYATLGAVLEAVEGPLAEQGILVMQAAVETPLGWALATTLVHAPSGQRMTGLVPMVWDAESKLNPMQSLGSAISYARRYGLMSVLGLIAEDDDGAGAYPPRQQQHREPERRPEPPRNGNGGPPRTGRALFAWASEARKDTGIDIVKWLGDWGRAKKVGDKVVEFPDAAVGAAYEAACRHLDASIAATEGGNDD